MKNATLIVLAFTGLFIFNVKAQNPMITGASTLNVSPKNSTTEVFISNTSSQNASATELVLSQTSGAIGNNGLACNTPAHDGNEATSGDNFYARTYDLGIEGFYNDVQLTGIEFAIGSLAGTNTVRVMFFDYPGFPTDFDISNLPASLSSKIITVNPSMVGTLVRVDFNTPVVVDQNAKIVAVVQEVFENQPALFLGTADEETQPSYIASIACELNVPLPTVPSFPDSKHIINLVVDTAAIDDCSGTPDGGVATVSAEEGIPGSTYTVSASGFTFENGLTYQWQSNTDGAGWVNEGAAVSTYSPYTATAPAELGTVVAWRLEVTCTLSTDIAYSDIATFTTVNIYCNASSTTVQPITRVVFAGIDNASSPDGTDAYENFTATTPAQVEVGRTYSFAAEGNTGGEYSNYFTVWIDWNQDGEFEIDEKYEIGSIYESTGIDGEQAINNILVPINVIHGDTRMRVRKNYNSPFSNPCDENTFGQTEDYTINVAPFDGYVYSDGIWSPEAPSGVTTASDDVLVVNGSSSLTSATTLNDLNVLSGATLEIKNVLDLNGDIYNYGDLIFVSNASGNGELAALPVESNIMGDVTVQRYMKNRRSYRMLSSTVTTTTSIHDNWQEGASSNTDDPNPGFGTHITGTTTDQMNGFDGTITGNPSMFTVNVATQQFQAIAETEENILIAGVPYFLFVRGDRFIDLGDDLASGETVIRATGSLYTGISIQDFPTVNEGSFAMFGNPFQSAVDVVSIFANSINVNNGHYYVYDPTLGDFGAYTTVSLSGGGATGGSNANQYLQPGQAAQFATSGNGSSSIVISELDKAPGQFTNTSATDNGLSADNMLTVALYTTENYSNGGSAHDGFGIIFGDSFSNTVTNEDAVKPLNIYENLGRNNNGTYLSIEKREMPQAAEEFALYSSGYQHSEYTLKVTVDGLDTNYFYLADHFTGIRTLLETGENTYSFSVDANDLSSIATDRFTIHTEQRLGVDDNSLLAGIRLYPNPLNSDTFYINAPRLNGEQLTVSISDLTGRSIYEQTLDCRANTVTVPIGGNVVTGVYLVTLKHGGETHTYRLIKE